MKTREPYKSENLVKDTLVRMWLSFIGWIGQGRGWKLIAWQANNNMKLLCAASKLAMVYDSPNDL